jgi:prophage antirepressor-like protein
MTDLIPFEISGAESVRFGLTDSGRAYVVADDFTPTLGYSRSRDALRMVDASEKGAQTVRTPGGHQKMNVLYEEGIWELVFLSRRPEAKAVKARVKAILRELREHGMVVDEARITDTQIEQGQKRLERIARGRLEEKSDYKSILHSLKLGGAVADEYRFVQNTLYLSLFGLTAAQIRTGEQQSGKVRKDGKGLVKSTVAKDFLTPPQLALLNSTVLATVAQIELHHPEGATAAQMIDAIHRAISIIKRPLSGGAA